MVMMPDPQKLAAVQEVTRNIRGQIVMDFKANSLTMILNTQDPAGTYVVHDLIEQLTHQLATQLKTFFAINGEITQVGEKAPKPSA